MIAEHVVMQPHGRRRVMQPKTREQDVKVTYDIWGLSLHNRTSWVLKTSALTSTSVVPEANRPALISRTSCATGGKGETIGN